MIYKASLIDARYLVLFTLNELIQKGISMHLIHETIYYLGLGSGAAITGAAITTATMVLPPMGLIGLGLFITGGVMEIWQKTAKKTY